MKLNNFIKVLNSDVYISTWEKRGYSHNHGSGIPHINSYNNVLKEEIITKYKNIINIDIENEEEWIKTSNQKYIEIYKNGFIWDNQYIRGTVVPQTYKLYKANEMKKKYEKENNFKYDLVIRTRPDNLHFCNLDNNYLDLKKIYAINNYPHYYPNRIFDIFFYFHFFSF